MSAAVARREAVRRSTTEESAAVAQLWAALEAVPDDLEIGDLGVGDTTEEVEAVTADTERLRAARAGR